MGAAKTSPVADDGEDDYGLGNTQIIGGIDPGLCRALLRWIARAELVEPGVRPDHSNIARHRVSAWNQYSAQ